MDKPQEITFKVNENGELTVSEDIKGIDPEFFETFKEQINNLKDKIENSELIEPMIILDPFDSFIQKRITKMQLAELRKSKHLTQKEISEMSGLSVQCISDIESENSGNPTLRSLLKYLDCMGYEMYFKKKVL